jgi:hypothetical protein
MGEWLDQPNLNFKALPLNLQLHGVTAQSNLKGLFCYLQLNTILTNT